MAEQASEEKELELRDDLEASLNVTVQGVSHVLEKERLGQKLHISSLPLEDEEVGKSEAAIGAHWP